MARRSSRRSGRHTRRPRRRAPGSNSSEYRTPQAGDGAPMSKIPKRLVKLGMDVVERVEHEKFTLGWVAEKIERDFGKSGLQLFAAEVGIDQSFLTECRRIYRTDAIEALV